MPGDPEKPSAEPVPSPARLWAEQLAMGMGMFVAILVFMAFKHPAQLSAGSEVLSTGNLSAYGWQSAVFVLLHFIIHEGASLVAARRFGLPLRFRLFPFGVNAAATLSAQPRRVWTDAMVGLAGPLVGTAFSIILALIYQFGGDPFFLGMACVGSFYNLFTLVPILDLEGGWILPALAPQYLLIGLFGSVLELVYQFNLVLLGVVAFGVPRLFLLVRARARARGQDSGRLAAHDDRRGLLHSRAGARLVRHEHVRGAGAANSGGDGRLAWMSRCSISRRRTARSNPN